MYIEQNFISKEQAKEICKSLANNLGGCLPENRVMIVTPDNTNVKVGNILLPDNTDKKDLPRKGVIVQIGCLSEENIYYKDLLSIGRVLTYGMYAGKELDFPKELFSNVEGFNPDDHTFTVLSIQEIVYSELNKK
jgi:co-chaperonin GroES (HSP10)|nr:MAG TPA: hypothetical protein [Caudoviricetes sp.]